MNQLHHQAKYLKPTNIPTLWTFIDRVTKFNEPGFHTSYPSGYKPIIGIHDAHKKAIAWETPLSFAAYQLTEWIAQWRSEHHCMTPEESILLQVWEEGVRSDDWSEHSMTCWQRRPRPEHYPTSGSNHQQQMQLIIWNMELDQAIGIFNLWVERCRARLLICGKNDRQKRLRAQSSRNNKSVNHYLDQLRAQYKRLLMVRLDLFYKPEYRNSKGMPQLQADRAAFMKHWQVNPLFSHLVGYVWCFEYGGKKGLHCHMLLIFNGKERYQDEWIGRMLGEHWEQVTHGHGGYFNSNAADSKKALMGWQQARNSEYITRLEHLFGTDEASRLKQLTLEQIIDEKNTLGIGMVDRSSEVCWANLRLVMDYFTKMDQAIPAAIRQGVRCFGKGQV